MDNLTEFEEWCLDRWHKRCVSCHEHFTDANVFTKEGMAEVDISEMCEKCFDELFKEEDEEY